MDIFLYGDQKIQHLLPDHTSINFDYWIKFPFYMVLKIPSLKNTPVLVFKSQNKTREQTDTISQYGTIDWAFIWE